MEREIVGVFGRTGYGKTLWARHYVADKPRLFIYDPKHDPDVLESEDWGGAQWIRQISEVADGLPETFAIGISDPDQIDDFVSLAMRTGNAYLVLDEAATLFPLRAPISPSIRTMIFEGRHSALSTVIVAQRPFYVPIDLRSQIDRCVSFRQTEKRDVEFFSLFFSDAQIDALPTLAPLTCHDSLEDGNPYSIAEAVGITIDPTRNDSVRAFPGRVFPIDIPKLKA